MDHTTDGLSIRRKPYRADLPEVVPTAPPIADQVLSQPPEEFDRWDALTVVDEGRVRREIPLDPKHFHNLDVDQAYIAPLRANVLDGTPLFPISLHLGPTNACFLECKDCWTAGVREDEGLSLETMVSILDQARALGTMEVRFHGPGEPTFNPAALEAMEHACQIGLKVALFTNGVRLTESYMRRLIAQPNFMFMWISPKADDAVGHREMTGAPESSFDKMMRNVEVAGRLRKEYGREDDLVLKGSTIISTWSYEHFARTATTFRDAGFDVFKAILHVPTFHDVLRDNEQVIAAEVDRLRQLDSPTFVTNAHEIPTRFDADYVRFKTAPHQCHVADTRLYIDGKGECFPCLDWMDNQGTRGYSLGNAVETTLQAIWDGELRRSLAAAISGESGHPVCGYCATPQPSEAISEIKLAIRDYPKASFTKRRRVNA